MINFTKQERQAVLFVLIVGLLGAGINFLAKTFPFASKYTSFSSRVFKIDLNKSDKAALMSVSGIGEKIAQRILDHRDSNGDFRSMDELREIKGITNLRYEKLAELFYVE